MNECQSFLLLRRCYLFLIELLFSQQATEIRVLNLVCLRTDQTMLRPEIKVTWDNNKSTYHYKLGFVDELFLTLIWEFYSIICNFRLIWDRWAQKNKESHNLLPVYPCSKSSWVQWFTLRLIHRWAISCFLTKFTQWLNCKLICPESNLLKVYILPAKWYSSLSKSQH